MRTLRRSWPHHFSAPGFHLTRCRVFIDVRFAARTHAIGSVWGLYSSRASLIFGRPLGLALYWSNFFLSGKRPSHSRQLVLGCAGWRIAQIQALCKCACCRSFGFHTTVLGQYLSSNADSLQQVSFLQSNEP
jgi:hypothetical protein